MAKNFLLVYSCCCKPVASNREQIKLVIADNGIGTHPIINDKENEWNYLGIELMKGLIKDINGKIYFEAEKGTKIMVIFSVDPLNDNKGLLITSTEKTVNQ
jgi:two-component sensor histidine kinase